MTIGERFREEVAMVAMALGVVSAAVGAASIGFAVGVGGFNFYIVPECSDVPQEWMRDRALPPDTPLPDDAPRPPFPDAQLSDEALPAPLDFSPGAVGTDKGAGEGGS